MSGPPDNAPTEERHRAHGATENDVGAAPRRAHLRMPDHAPGPSPREKVVNAQCEKGPVHR
jgi:hypothetical protein